MKLGELATRLGCRLEGDAQAEVRGVAGIEAAGPGEVTFLSNPRYTRALATTRASAVLIGRQVSIERKPGTPPLAALRSDNPYLDFARAIEFFHAPHRYRPEIHPTAVIAASAKLGAGAHVGPYCFVDEGAEIGRNAVLHSFVTIYRNARIGDDFCAHSHAVVREDCRLGNRVILQNGVVIGGDGFGFARRADRTWQKIVQNAPVVIEDDVEIQSNACVDRATVGETRVRRGAKIDDLVLVGHACDVGEDTLLCGQVGLAGSTQVGSRCILAGQVGSAGHLAIGDGATITSQSGVPSDVPAGSIYSGYPAMENRQWLKAMAAVKRLPETLKAVRGLAGARPRLKTAKRRAPRT
jgi:UDP-3-O-[3-hydroxymyristoyl] glucosamine N-acyltransferase